MSLSVTTPIQRAWDRMVEILFKPFSLGKWLGLGFCFFLANLGRSGFSFNFNFPTGGGGGGGGTTTPPTTPAPATIPPHPSPTGPAVTPSMPGPPAGNGMPTHTPVTPPGSTPAPAGPGQAPGVSHATTTNQPVPQSDADLILQGLQDAFNWIMQNLTVILWIAGGLIVFAFTLWLIVLWLRCRGVFMAIDGLALNRGDIKKPWARYRRAGNSLFLFTLVLQLIATVLVLTAIATAVWVAWPDLSNQTFGVPAIWGIIILAVALPLIAVHVFIIDMLLTDFIAPTMYIHDLRVNDAWRLWYREVFKGHFWLITLFYLMKMLLGIAIGIASVFAICLTCCFVVIPYVGTVILLPAFVFMRGYSLYFIEQFGEPWRLFVYDERRTPCVDCGYDLQGTPDVLTCPECGQTTPRGLEAQWAV